MLGLNSGFRGDDSNVANLSGTMANLIRQKPSLRGPAPPFRPVLVAFGVVSETLVHDTHHAEEDDRLLL
jgi:hypothetical protein